MRLDSPVSGCYAGKMLSRSVDYAQSPMTVLFTLTCIIVGFGVNACGNRCSDLSDPTLETFSTIDNSS